ncbi:cation-translocating P-type ATPase [Candidatus Woesearchaeota archaeon]|nr:cation-translocating P-type ATPase [Candidatus Woesearchaeota archaeon]
MVDYYKQTSKEALESLNTNIKGLTHEEAEKRLQQYGLNQLKKKESVHPVKIFLKQFKDPVIMILLAAIIISLTVNEMLDAAVITAILILNAVIGFSQEYKAEKAIELLKKMSTPKAKVIRNGTAQLIDASLVVPGDIITVEAGDKVPADARILDLAEVHVNESMLTGESVPVKKDIPAIGKEVALADRKNMLFSGTVLTNGRADAVVVSTGMSTELGKIAELVQTIGEVQTPLQKRLKSLGEKLGIIVLMVCAVVLTIGFLRGLDKIQMLLMAISLAVSAVPEGLPAVVTIALAIGVQKMLKRNALIRELKAVETLGAVTVICSDKTGTMTKNEMTVTEIFANNETITVTGEGYNIKGEFLINNKKITAERIDLLLRAAASCNNATLTFGDPTEIALVVAAKKAGIEREEKTGEIPFDSVKKYMVTKHKGVNYIKGAPEKILELCTHIQSRDTVKKLTDNDRKLILNKNYEMGSKALRVLAMAYEKDKKTVLTGLAGMIDPPREEVAEAMRVCEKAGIKVIMITGDNAVTAKAIGEKIGINGRMMEGTELEKASDEDLRKVVKEVNIFARVDPSHKVRILKALQANGEVVAMTGDGVNDAPALKGADVGVAMAIKGTDIARESADMVLTDDNFVSIVAAVREGRAIYDNIKKFVKFLLSTNFGEVGVITLSIIAGIPLPLLPIQILWVNLLTDSLPALALGVDPPDGKIMERKPRNPKDTILQGSYTFLVIASLIATIATLVAFFIGCGGWDCTDLNKGRTMALMTLIFFELGFVFTIRSEKLPLYKVGLFSNKWLVRAVLTSVAMQLIIVYIPLLSRAFKLVPLGLLDWAAVIPLALSGFIIFEIKKMITYKEQ